MYQQYQHILAPVDGSKEAELAFKKAVQVSLRNNASLLITHVIDVRSVQTTAGYEGTLSDELVNQAQNLLDDYEKYAHDQGLENVKTLVDYGSPRAEIAKEIPEKYDIDLIMIGATGLNAIERLFIGSVSEYVIRNAPCDVLVVRTNLENEQISHEED